ncbi:hypothetical protein ACJZ2D_009465 [Fusarium nematophilum]
MEPGSSRPNPALQFDRVSAPDAAESLPPQPPHYTAGDLWPQLPKPLSFRWALRQLLHHPNRGTAAPPLGTIVSDPVEPAHSLTSTTVNSLQHDCSAGQFGWGVFLMRRQGKARTRSPPSTLLRWPGLPDHSSTRLWYDCCRQSSTPTAVRTSAPDETLSVLGSDTAAQHDPSSISTTAEERQLSRLLPICGSRAPAFSMSLAALPRQVFPPARDLCCTGCEATSQAKSREPCYQDQSFPVHLNPGVLLLWWQRFPLALTKTQIPGALFLQDAASLVAIIVVLLCWIYYERIG